MSSIRGQRSVDKDLPEPLGAFATYSSDACTLGLTSSTEYRQIGCVVQAPYLDLMTAVKDVQSRLMLTASAELLKQDAFVRL